MDSQYFDVQAWYRTPLGEMLAGLEDNHTEVILSNLFGYHILQLCGDKNYLSSARVKNKVLITRNANSSLKNKSLLAKASALPIATDSVDIVVLPHTLEISDRPHEVLREVERVLIAEGRIVIMGFNPWSLVGMRRLLSWRSLQFPWCSQFISLPRVTDWLTLLGFEVEECRRHFFIVPFQSRAMMSQHKWVESVGKKIWPFFSGAYILVAKKRVSTITPIRPRWGAHSLVASDAVEVSVRMGNKTQKVKP